MTNLIDIFDEVAEQMKPVTMAHLVFEVMKEQVSFNKWVYEKPEFTGKLRDEVYSDLAVFERYWRETHGG